MTTKTIAGRDLKVGDDVLNHGDIRTINRDDEGCYVDVYFADGESETFDYDQAVEIVDTSSSPPPATAGLTARQAHRLNQLADACAGTYQAALAVKARAEHIARQVSKGHHIEGFPSDVLGQPGREVQHYASQREVLIRAAAGCPQAAIDKALTNTTQHDAWFSEGDQYPDTDEVYGPGGEPLPRGRCDTCGTPCHDVTGVCTNDPTHKTSQEG